MIPAIISESQCTERYNRLKITKGKIIDITIRKIFLENLFFIKGLIKNIPEIIKIVDAVA